MKASFSPFTLCHSEHLRAFNNVITAAAGTCHVARVGSAGEGARATFHI